MPVQMLCPNLRCRRILSVPEQVRGKLVQCHHCSTLFRVPNQPTRAEMQKSSPAGVPTSTATTVAGNTPPSAPAEPGQADKSAA